MIEIARVAVLVAIAVCVVLLPASVIARRLIEADAQGGDH